MPTLSSKLHPLTQSSYRPLDESGVLRYLAECEGVRSFLGRSTTAWTAREIGDGNLNLVFQIVGNAGSVVVKQALPYVRMVGESWPLSLKRAHFESLALIEQQRWSAGLVPQVHHIDPPMALIVMEYLAPHVVVRKGLIDGQSFPLLGQDLGVFLARSLSYTSDLYLSPVEKRQGIARFAENTAMCRITEDLVFDEPYFDAPLNRHTEPMLDEIARDIRRDVALKIQVQELKCAFMNAPECLLHGDLHTGSIMATASDTRVIDPEFACFGPMGFDLGMLLANLLLAYLSESARDTANARRLPVDYLRNQVTLLWSSFCAELGQLFNARPQSANGNALYSRRLSVDSPAMERAALEALLQKIWVRALGFAGCEMIRRILGLAHVEDFEAIPNPVIRAERETETLHLARDLIVRRHNYSSVRELLAAAAAHA